MNSNFGGLRLGTYSCRFQVLKIRTGYSEKTHTILILLKFLRCPGAKSSLTQYKVLEIGVCIIRVKWHTEVIIPRQNTLRTQYLIESQNQIQVFQVAIVSL